MSELSELTILPVGDSTAEYCEGDVCIVPPHPEQRAMNRRLDDDRV